MAGLSYCPRCLTTFRDEGPDRCPNLSCGSTAPEEGWGHVLQPGDLIDRHYRIEKVLAVGGAGLTYLAREVDGANDPVGPRLAVKVLYSARASGAYLRRLATEAQILQELDHEHIVQCRGFVHRAGHEPYLVTLFEDGGSLARHLKRVGPLNPSVAASVLRQILLGLDTAHQRGVVHRDLKPDNVLLSSAVAVGEEPHIRVADFGIAKVAGGLGSKITKLGAFVGTPEYAAPEQFEQHGASAATDIFACGGLLYFMLTGNAPVDLSRRSDIEQSYDELLDQLPPTLDRILAPEASDEELEQLNKILANTMAVRQEHRWTAHQVIAELTPLTGREVVRSTTLEVTSEPPPKRQNTPLDSNLPVGLPPVVDKGETQPFLIGQMGNDAEDSEPEVPADDIGADEDTAKMVPYRTAEPTDKTLDGEEPDESSELVPEAASEADSADDAPADVVDETGAAEEAAGDGGVDVPVPPAEPPPSPEPTPPAPPQKKRRSWVGLLVGAVVVLFLGSTGLAAGVVVLAAVGLIAADDLPIALPGGVGEPEAPAFDPDDPVALSGAERRAVQAALQDLVGDDGCGGGGPVVVSVVIDPEGAVLEASVDPMFFKVAEADAEACLVDFLAQQSLEGVEAGAVRAALLR